MSASGQIKKQKPNKRKAPGYDREKDVRDALSGDLTRGTRTRLREELKTDFPDTYKRLVAKRRSRPTTQKPYNPLAARGGKDLLRQADSLTAQEFDPQERALNQQQTNIPAWFQDYQNQISASAANLKNQFDAQQGAAQARATNMATEAQTSNAALFDRLRADAEKRGATLDAGVQEQAERARQNRQSLANTFTQGVGTQGLNTATNYAGKSDSAARGRLEALTRLAGQQRGLKQQRGQRRTELIGQLEEKERRYALERSAFGLDQAKAQADMQESAADRALKKRGLDIQQQNADTNRYRAEKSPAGKKKRPTQGPGSLTRNQENTIIDGVNSAQAWVKRLRKGGAPESEIRNLLAGGGKIGPKGNKMTVPKIPKDYINAAYDLIVHGKLSQPNVAALHRRGLHIPPQWLKGKKRKVKVGPFEGTVGP